MQAQHPESGEGAPRDAIDVREPNANACTAAQRVEICCPPSALPTGAARAVNCQTPYSHHREKQTLAQARATRTRPNCARPRYAAAAKESACPAGAAKGGPRRNIARPHG
eukprot:13616720-Alexandrium_andersonii.AAC.1